MVISGSISGSSAHETPTLLSTVYEETPKEKIKKKIHKAVQTELKAWKLKFYSF